MYGESNGRHRVGFASPLNRSPESKIVSVSVDNYLTTTKTLQFSMRKVCEPKTTPPVEGNTVAGQTREGLASAGPLRLLRDWWRGYSDADLESLRAKLGDRSKAYYPWQVIEVTSAEFRALRQIC